MGSAVSCSGPRVKGLTSSVIGARLAFPKLSRPWAASGLIVLVFSPGGLRPTSSHCQH